ncbi:MAG: flagellar basal body-associated FliL family protein [Methylococcaceae bacterium]
MRVILSLLLFSLFSPCMQAEDEKEAPTIEYLQMNPKFIVNLQERKKFLRADVQLLVEGDNNIEKIKKNMPALRHELIMLFSGLSYEEIETAQQREELRKLAHAKLTDALSKFSNSDGFRDLYFTEFLIN